MVTAMNETDKERWRMWNIGCISWIKTVKASLLMGISSQYASQNASCDPWKISISKISGYEVSKCFQGNNQANISRDKRSHYG